MCGEKTAKLLKKNLDIVHRLIAEVCNEIAAAGDGPTATGDGLIELIFGALNANQKPGKKKGPKNLRPIIFHSILRRLFAICMKQYIIDRTIEKIPPTHAAYRQGRSTTEDMFAEKFLTEKAVASKDHPIYLLLLNMSKAFETVDGQVSLNDLERTTNTDELHLISVMVSTKLQVQCENSMSDIFVTKTEVPQGDGGV